MNARGGNFTLPLELCGIGISLSGYPVLAGVSLRVSPGQIVWLTGPNGRGKSSLLRIAAGVWRPDSGEVFVNGISMLRDPISCKSRLAYVPDENGLFARLSVRTYLELLLSLYPGSGPQAIGKGRELLSAFQMDDCLDARLASLSQGQRKKVDYALAFAHKPRLYVIDEAFDAIDGPGRAFLREAISEAARSGAGVIFTSHEEHHPQGLADVRIELAAGSAD